jgi:hypothetical protein
MIDAMINTKIGEFLEKEAMEAGVRFDEVEASMKLQEVKDKNQTVVGFKPYYYLRIKGKFVRYVEITELI